MMKRLLFVLIVALVVVGCKSFDDLEDGNNLAIQNQKNLEPNALRGYDNFKKLGKAINKWDDSDEEIWQKQRGETVKQLAINRAWLIVLQEAINRDSVDSALLGKILQDLPGWIKEGKDVYDLVKSKFDKEE
jgi:hypothetical protein